MSDFFEGFRTMRNHMRRVIHCFFMSFSMLVVGTAFAQAPIERQAITPPPSAATAAEALKVQGNAHCFCNFQCSSGTKSTSFSGYTQAWPGEKNRCQNACQNYLNSSIENWAREAKNCTTFRCSGTYHVGTQSPEALSGLTINTAGKPWCTDDPAGNACCPEFTKNITPGHLYSMFVPSAHGHGQPYTMTYDSNSAFSNQLEGYFNHWTNWLKVDGCSGVAGFKIQYNLYNTGTAVKAQALAYVPSGAPQATSTVNYMSGTANPPSFVWNVPPNTNYWYVSMTVTTIGTHGQPVECAKDDGCFKKFFTGWIDDSFSAGKVSSGGNRAAAGSSSMTVLE